jgi:hypothetical protein
MRTWSLDMSFGDLVAVLSLVVIAVALGVSIGRGMRE